MQTTTTLPYKGFRLPQEIISHAVWLYCRLSLSYREVEQRRAERASFGTDATGRQGCGKFGPSNANQ